MSVGEQETTECDRCEATIVLGMFERPTPFNCVIDVSEPDDGDPMYEQVQRILCRACEHEFLTEFCDGEETPDRSYCVDLPRTVTAARNIERTARTLETVAETMRDSLEADFESETAGDSA